LICLYPSPLSNCARLSQYPIFRWPRISWIAME